MAIKGVDITKYYPYVPECDRHCEEKEQTRFYIRPKTVRDTDRTFAKYSKGIKETPRGIREINPEKIFLADMDDFVSICQKVENFMWSSGEISTLVETEEQLMNLFRELPNEIAQEVLSVSSEWSKMGEVEKKD